MNRVSSFTSLHINNRRKFPLSPSSSESKNKTTMFRETYSKRYINSGSNEFFKECPFHSNSNKYSLQLPTPIQNECPGGDSCVNFKKVKALEYQIKKLKMTLADLTKLNDYFVFTINQKDEMYRSLIKENTSIKNTILLNSMTDNRSYRMITKSKENSKSDVITMNDNINDNSNLAPTTPSIMKFNDNENKNNISNGILSSSYLNRSKSLKRQSVANVIENKTKQLYANTLLYNEEKNINNFIDSNHYDKIIEISNKSNKNKLQNSSGVSFLSLSNKRLDEIANNENLEFINRMTQSDEIFISKIRTASKEFLINLCDVLNIVIKDYQQTIRLIQRVKLFLSSSVNLVRSVLSANSPTVLLNNTCEILDCERASLFIYDTLSDMLVVHSGEGLKKNQIKVPKDKGIVGAVFMKKEKLKIDDAYQDPRFNPEVDKKTNFKTRNLLCFPLIDKEGDTFGAIQAINKRKKHFNHDDEELMLILSRQASAILKSMMNMDENCLQISRLKMILKYSVDINQIKEISKFVLRTEELLMTLFSSASAQILFVTKLNELYHYPSKKTLSNKNLGIVNFVLRKKECHGCSKVKNCNYYNALVDIPASESLITYPIVIDNKCIGIIQAILNCDFSENLELPKDNEMSLLNVIEESFKSWYSNNRNLFNL